MRTRRRGSIVAASSSFAAAIVLALGQVVPALRALSPIVWGVTLVLLLVAFKVAVRAWVRQRR